MYNAMSDDGFTIQLTGKCNRDIAARFIGDDRCYKHIISRNTRLAQMEVVYEDKSTNEYLVDVSYVIVSNIDIVISILRKMGFTGKAYVYNDFDDTRDYIIRL